MDVLNDEARSATEPLPKLAFVYQPVSTAAMAIANSARGRCELLWLVDTNDSRLGPMTRLLARLGTVLDVAGKTPPDAASVLSAHGVDGVLALSDDLLVWTAAVAEALRLPFLSPDAARRLTDKYEQRAAFRAADLASPRSWALTSETSDADWSTVQLESTLPGVLKPRHGAASRDTVFVTSIQQTRAVIAESMAAGDPADRGWVLEEYIADIDHAVCGDGFANYVSVETIVLNGHPTHVAVTGRTPPAKPFRETGLFIPAEVDSVQAAELAGTAGRAILALGAHSGCFHTEIKLTPTGPVVIEVNGRIGGGVAELLALTAEIDFLGMAIEIALGRLTTPDSITVRGIGYHLLAQPPEDLRTVTVVEGLEAVSALPGVREVVLNRRPGDHVDLHDGNMGYVFGVLGVANDHEELRSIMGKVASLVRIDGEHESARN